ncbi:hypothetical protein [Pedobacter sp. GR22-6]|uniref:hypothetical protein n=1 Tax=Pedobacter sp. GR22-6 TaxID=3127957 RepID=UPI00307CE406
MEVLPIFTAEASLIDLFREFLVVYEETELDDKDDDTLFLNRKGRRFHEIYFHNYFDDTPYELSYNHSESEKSIIELFFDGKEIKSFSVQYKDLKFLDTLLRDLRFSLKSENVLQWTLLVHPLKRVVKLSDCL